jgi:hypothetical protein
MRDASGQATIEWLGLVLVAGLVLGALAAFRAPAQDRELGAVVAKRITCAAAGQRCVKAGAGAVRSGAVLPGALLRGPPKAGLRDRRVAQAKAVDAFRRLRGLGKLTRWGWILCLGYRRYVYERDHLRAPTEPMPLKEALETANACLNPLAFVEDG